MTTLEIACIVVLGVVVLVGLAVLLLRSAGKIGPHRDNEAWSVRGADARSEDRRVRAQVQALRVEAEVISREYRGVPQHGEG